MPLLSMSGEKCLLLTMSGENAFTEHEWGKCLFGSSVDEKYN